MKYKSNQVVRLKPDAEVSLSYKDGSPPLRFIKNELWMIDAVEDLDDGQMLNISTFESVGNINAGSYCSFVYSDDVKEVVDVYRNKKAYKQLIEEVDYEPTLFAIATKDNHYKFTVHDNIEIIFESKKFKPNWCRLIYRVYNTKEGIGGYQIDVILMGDMEEVFYELENITLFNKRKYGSLKVIQRKVDNKVPYKYTYTNIFEK